MALLVVAGLLLVVFVPIPHLIFLPITVWSWGAAVGAAFIAYSAAVSALYLSLTLRLIDGIPFGMKFDQNRPLRKLARMTLGGFVVVTALGLQYVLFRSGVAVAAATPLVGGAAYFMTRRSLISFEASMRQNLKMDSA